jgi:hypothetical protein
MIALSRKDCNAHAAWCLHHQVVLRAVDTLVRTGQDANVLSQGYRKVSSTQQTTCLLHVYSCFIQWHKSTLC